MKKDYVVISDDQIAVDEKKFVEDFWTQRWDKKAQLPKINSVERRKEFQLMQPFLSTLPNGSRILDGGCGMGEWTAFLTNRGFEVTGLDISQHTIERLKELLPHCRFVHGDIRQTEFPDAFFDVYFSWGTFEHFELGLGECVQEAYRILRPGGMLFVSVPFQNWRHIFHEAKAPCKRARTKHSQQTPLVAMRFYQWRLTRIELERELAIQGFDVLKVVPIHIKEGLKRTLHYDFGLKRGSWLHRKITRYLRSVIPSSWLAHMIIAIARKKGDEDGLI